MTPFESWWLEKGQNIEESTRMVAWHAWIAGQEAALVKMTEAAERIVDEKAAKPKPIDTDDWIKIRKEGGIESSGRAKDLGMR